MGVVLFRGWQRWRDWTREVIGGDCTRLQRSDRASSTHSTLDVMSSSSAFIRACRKVSTVAASRGALPVCNVTRARSMFIPSSMFIERALTKEASSSPSNKTNPNFSTKAIALTTRSAVSVQSKALPHCFKVPAIEASSSVLHNLSTLRNTSAASRPHFASAALNASKGSSPHATVMAAMAKGCCVATLRNFVATLADAIANNVAFPEATSSAASSAAA
mmetsp:Transcript_18202/g.51866  ORF Transcript_18202/g.51866 Transcript_18202/m.51866 type:complete len:219 (+) Transcript_18202:765-1421(+)